MNKLFKGLVATTLALSCVSPMYAAEKTEKEDSTLSVSASNNQTYVPTCGECWRNPWVKGLIFGEGLALLGFIGYIIVDKFNLI